jgi:hypothetical protein
MRLSKKKAETAPFQKHLNTYFINNLETGLKHEKETILGLDYMFNEDGESSRIQAYFT